MNMYYVEIHGKLKNELAPSTRRLHAEFVMTDSTEKAKSVAWEHLLSDANESCRVLLSNGMIETVITSELITDVTTLGDDKAVYYTDEILR